jgi:hypothetical protein
MVEFSCAVVPVLHMYIPNNDRKKLNVRKYSFGTLCMYMYIYMYVHMYIYMYAHVHTTFWDQDMIKNCLICGCMEIAKFYEALKIQGCQMVCFQTKNSNLGKF